MNFLRGFLMMRLCPREWRPVLMTALAALTRFDSGDDDLATMAECAANKARAAEGLACIRVEIWGPEEQWACALVGYHPDVLHQEEKS